jgi:LacI family transcriptional regulator
MRSSVVNIRDVAKRAGVSVATVSYVLNGSRKVSPQVREAVLRAVEETGYLPNAVAKSLREQRTRTLGIVVPDIGNPFFSALIKAFEACARSRGYRVIAVSSEESPDLEEDALRNLAARQVEGIALVPTRDTPTYLPRQIALVAIDRLSDGLDIDGIGVDNEGSAYEAASFLLNHGHRRILVLLSDPSLANIRERIRGYQRALEDWGLPVDPSLQVGCGRGPSGEIQDQLVEVLWSLRPTAVFPVTNRLTLYALHALKKLNLRVPEDVSVIGFDDFEWSSLLDPPLTVVAQPVEAMGREACQVLLQRVTASAEQKASQIRLPCSLVVRGSVAPPKGELVGR